METYLILIRISQFSSIIPVIIGLFFYKKLNKSFKSLVWFLLFFVFMEYFAYWLAKELGNNMPLSHIFTVIEFGMLISVFTTYFKIQMKYYYILLFLIVFIGIIDAFVLKKLTTFGGLTNLIASIFFTIAALYFYYNNINQTQNIDLYKQPMFWFSTSILIYFSINFYKYLRLSTELKLPINTYFIDYIIHSITNTIANLLYAMAFLSFKWKTS
ncbi:MAG: hypothetical protein ACOYMA_04700 [Bacteroidia bacterium]